MNAKPLARFFLHLLLAATVPAIAAASTTKIMSGATPDSQAPTTPASLSASSVTSTSVALSWTASTDDVAVATYDLYSGSMLAGSSASSSAAIQNLLPGTSYTFSVRARDAAGNASAASKAVTVTTLSSNDVSPPSAPANLAWSNAGGTVTLVWSASTDDVGVIAYDLYFGSFYLGAFGETSLAMLGFKAGTPYTFTVKARDAAGNVSVASNTATVLLAADRDTTPPSAPTKLAVANVTSTSVTLSWTASTDDVGVVLYQVYAGATVAATTFGTTSAAISGLTPATSYAFTVKALDAANNVSAASAAVSVTTPAAADFTLSSSPATVLVTPGTRGSSTITIARSTGFSDAVTLTASGLPSGVTASFSPASATGTSSTLTLTASSSAAVGSSQLTVTGSGGGITRTTAVTLSVVVTSGGGGGGSGVACAGRPVWNSKVTYSTAGDLIEYDCKLYQNQGYAYGVNPETNNGQYYQWLLVGSCSESDCAMGEGPWTSCGAWDHWTTGAYEVYNDVWGSGAGQQCITAWSGSRWAVNSTQPATSGVKSYPNSGFLNLNKKISALSTFTSSFDVSVPASGDWEATYDIWVPTEIMVWMYTNGNVGPIAASWDSSGKPVASATNVTVGGHTWNVYHQNGGSNVISFVRTANTTQGTVDIKALLAWAMAQGWIPDGTVGAVQFGFEISGTNGAATDFATNAFSITAN
jgi:chitodextrinase